MLIFTLQDLSVSMDVHFWDPFFTKFDILHALEVFAVIWILWHGFHFYQNTPKNLADKFAENADSCISTSGSMQCSFTECIFQKYKITWRFLLSMSCRVDTNGALDPGIHRDTIWGGIKCKNCYWKTFMGGAMVGIQSNSFIWVAPDIQKALHATVSYWGKMSTDISNITDREKRKKIMLRSWTGNKDMLRSCEATIIG